MLHSGRPVTSMYQSRVDLYHLLTKLCSFPTMTGTSGEQLFATELEAILRCLPYFEQHPEALIQYDVGQGRSVVAARVMSQRKTNRTAVIIAHYDVVAVDEYGEHAHLAFSPETWTERIRCGDVALPNGILDEQGEWLFGRGVMDMKCGLALNISLLEQACNGRFDGNVVFLAVPDEERHSDGMLGAANLLLQWGQQYGLSYSACLDTEPAFTQNDEDGQVVYTGTIGKLLLGAYCIGKETHVGDPFAGLSGTTMTSFLNQAFEYNAALQETSLGEQTPPVTCLYSRDLKPQYSVQTPYKSASYYNLFLMARRPSEVLQCARTEAKVAMAALAKWFQARQQSAGHTGVNLAANVTVMTLSELQLYVQTHNADAATANWTRFLQAQEAGLDDRAATVNYVDDLASACPQLHPLVVLYFAPPFYPAVTSAEHPVIRFAIEAVKAHAKTAHALTLRETAYFPGLSDLSYTSLGQAESDVDELRANMPSLLRGYELPLDALRQLNIPVMNVGPYGKDAHKWTERLEMNYSFDVVPSLLQVALHALFQDKS